MKCILTIADDSGIDIYAADNCSFVEHWYLNSFGTLSYCDVVSELCSQVGWTDCKHENCVCCLSSNPFVRNYFQGFNIIDKDSLLKGLGNDGHSVLIETRNTFFLADDSGCRTWLKDEIYDGPAAFLAGFADRKFMEIGCKESVVGSLPYFNTKRFFLNLIEQMPGDVNVIFVPVFASSGLGPLKSDRNFVELLWNESAGDQSLGSCFEDMLKKLFLPVMNNVESVLVYNAFLKNKIFI